MQDEDRYADSKQMNIFQRFKAACDLQNRADNSWVDTQAPIIPGIYNVLTKSRAVLLRFN